MLRCPASELPLSGFHISVSLFCTFRGLQPLFCTRTCHRGRCNLGHIVGLLDTLLSRASSLPIIVAWRLVRLQKLDVCYLLSLTKRFGCFGCSWGRSQARPFFTTSFAFPHLSSIPSQSPDYPQVSLFLTHTIHISSQLPPPPSPTQPPRPPHTPALQPLHPPTSPPPPSPPLILPLLPPPLPSTPLPSPPLHNSATSHMCMVDTASHARGVGMLQGGLEGMGMRDEGWGAVGGKVMGCCRGKGDDGMGALGGW